MWSYSVPEVGAQSKKERENVVSDERSTNTKSLWIQSLGWKLAVSR